MASCQADESIERLSIGPMAFPLGVYPVEEMQPVQGYSVLFEPSDGDDEAGDWEEWPDRYAYDIVLTAARVRAFCRQVFAMLPPRVYPILDVIGGDAYREIDPYISYELLGLDRFLDAVNRFGDFFYEDGLVGFGAMSEEPFLYVFVDEHKIVTIRAEPSWQERIEKLLRSFELQAVEEAAGADAAAHEHRGVLLAPRDRPDLLSGDEIVEFLRDEWRLILNVDAEENVDDAGKALGITPFRCLVRVLFESDPPTTYAEVLLSASCLQKAEDAAELAVVEDLAGKRDDWLDAMVLTADRIGPRTFKRTLARLGASGEASAGEDGHIHSIRWDV